MILVLVFGGVELKRQIDFAQVVYDEFSRRGHKTEVTVQVVSASSERIMIEKEVSRSGITVHIY